jgi:DNA-binding IscR family transcriptional regulator
MSVMRKLAEAGLIEGKLGAGGGYRLARPAGEITVLELLEAVEGRLDGDMNSTVSGVSHEAQKLIDGTVARVPSRR